jgi:putative thioredoxin
MDGTVISMGGQISGNGSGPADSEIIKDGSTATFMADVIEASRQVPVIVDFWAPWCGPCKQLGPMIEKIVKEAKGGVRLVKINVEENQALAGQMRVQSIPAVFAFSNGQPVDGFMGALPEKELREFVSRIAGPSKEQQQIEQLTEAAKTALANKEFNTAGQMFASILQVDRENTSAIAGLAKCQIEAGDTEGAEATLALVPADKKDDPEVASALAALELASQTADSAEITRLREQLAANSTDHQARYDLATALNAAGNREEALDLLIEIVRADRNWNDEAARKQLIKFFEAWGHSDEVTIAGRRRLSSLLFS